MGCNFTEWYQVKDNADILIIDKNVEDIKQYRNQKYDYIYLDGVLENAELLIESQNSFVDLINFFKELLKDDGILFIAVDNKLGIKYFVGNKSEHCDSIYDSFKNKFCRGRLFSKKELDLIIEQTGFINKKYYYPLPNYKIPNVIFTEEMLPQKNDSKINYNVIYDEGSLIVQDEIELLKTFINEGKFIEFTNSYIIELSNNEIKEKVKYYSFNNMRKEKYSLVLKMKNEYIEKYPKTEKAIEHIKNINKNSQKLKKLGFNMAEEENAENIVKSKFINLELLDKQIVRAIENKQISKAYELIDNWYKYIIQKLEKDENNITKDGFIDLVFENTFFDNKKNEYIFFDQEWYKENISIKFILYRTIKNLYEHNQEIEQKLPIQDMYEKYELKEELEEFQKLEKNLQEEVIDNEKKSFYSKQYNYKITLEEVKNLTNDVKKLDKDNIELTQEIKRLYELLKQKDDIISNQQNEIVNANKTLLNKIKDKIFKK